MSRFILVFMLRCPIIINASYSILYASLPGSKEYPSYSFIPESFIDSSDDENFTQSSSISSNFDTKSSAEYQSTVLSWLAKINKDSKVDGCP